MTMLQDAIARGVDGIELLHVSYIEHDGDFQQEDALMRGQWLRVNTARASQQGVVHVLAEIDRAATARGKLRAIAHAAVRDPRAIADTKHDAAMEAARPAECALGMERQLLRAPRLRLCRGHRVEPKNVATVYTDQIWMTSGDSSDVLPRSGAFVAGARSISLTFTTDGSHRTTVQHVAATMTPADNRQRRDQGRVAVPHRDGAGQPDGYRDSAKAFTATVPRFFNNVATNYTGTLHFVANDPRASVLADFTFDTGGDS
jgi:hypothetical protein